MEQKMIVNKTLQKISSKIIKTEVAGTGITTVMHQVAKSSQKVLKYLNNSPASISSRILLKNEYYCPKPDETLEEFFARIRSRREEILEEPIHCDFNVEDAISSKITDEKFFKKELNKFINPHIIKVANHLFENNLIFENTLNMLYDIDVASRNIKDTKVISALNSIYKEILNIEAKEIDMEISGDEDILINRANSIIDSYNTIKGNYVNLNKIDFFSGFMNMENKPSKTQEFLILYDFDIDEDEYSLYEQVQDYIENNSSTDLAKEFLLAFPSQNIRTYYLLIGKLLISFFFMIDRGWIATSNKFPHPCFFVFNDDNRVIKSDKKKRIIIFKFNTLLSF